MCVVWCGVVVVVVVWCGVVWCGVVWCGVQTLCGSELHGRLKGDCQFPIKAFVLCLAVAGSGFRVGKTTLSSDLLAQRQTIYGNSRTVTLLKYKATSCNSFSLMLQTCVRQTIYGNSRTLTLLKYKSNSCNSCSLMLQTCVHSLEE